MVGVDSDSLVTDNSLDRSSGTSTTQLFRRSCMSSTQDTRHDKRAATERRFTMFGLFLYVSVACVTFGTFGALTAIDELRQGPTMSLVIFVVSGCVIGALGAIIAVPVVLLVYSRRHVLEGAFLGGVGLATLWFLAAMVFAHHYY